MTETRALVLTSAAERLGLVSQKSQTGSVVGLARLNGCEVVLPLL
jgi:hypothetical protein